MVDLPLDRIHIRDLRLMCLVGVFEHEKHNLQEVVLNITLHTDLSRAGKSDRLEDTVDYKGLKERVAAQIEGSQFLLVERLAEEAAEICLQFPLVQRVDVLAEKPGALRRARTVGVEISRQKQEA